MRMEVFGKRPDLLAAFSRACRPGASCATSTCRTIPTRAGRLARCPDAKERGNFTVLRQFHMLLSVYIKFC